MTLDGTRKGKSAWYALGFYDGDHNLPAYGPDHEPDRIEKPEDLREYLRGYREAEARRAFKRDAAGAAKKSTPLTRERRRRRGASLMRACGIRGTHRETSRS